MQSIFERFPTLALASMLFVCSQTDLRAQQPLSAGDLADRISHRLGLCISILAGTYDKNDAGHLKHLVAQEQLGLLKTAQDGNTIIATAINPPHPNLRGYSGKYCIPQFYTHDVKILSIQKAQGGQVLKWDGFVAFTTYSVKPNPLFLQYNSLFGSSLGDVSPGRVKARFLFKYDPFKSGWNCVALDSAREDKEFVTNIVEAVLAGAAPHPLPHIRCAGL